MPHYDFWVVNRCTKFDTTYPSRESYDNYNFPLNTILKSQVLRVFFWGGQMSSNFKFHLSNPQKALRYLGQNDA